MVLILVEKVEVNRGVSRDSKLGARASQ